MVSIELKIHFWEDSHCKTYEITATKSMTILEVIELVLAKRFWEEPLIASQFVAVHEGAATDPATNISDLLNVDDPFRLVLDIRLRASTDDESPLITHRRTHDAVVNPDMESVDFDATEPYEDNLGDDGSEDDIDVAYFDADDAFEDDLGDDGYEDDFEEEEMDDVWDAEDEDKDDGFDTGESKVAGFVTAGKANKQRRTVVERRSTVRYFERMNPCRVYPLLVAFTKDALEEIVVSDVRQKTASKLQLDLSESLFVEPILPGCTCHPPIQTLRLRNPNDEGECRFFVVPMIQGPVAGAHIVIRQGEKIVAKLDLELTVVPTTWTMISAVLTLVVPFAVALLQQFQMNIVDKVQDSAGFYVAITMFAVAYTPAWVLTATLFTVTLLLFWHSRPREHDVFWTVSTTPADTRFAKIQKLSQSDLSEAANQLERFLKENPTHRKGLIFYANWHFNDQAYEHALDGFERALKLGKLKCRGYLRASISAARLANYQRALEIVRRAELDLPEDELWAVMLFNGGCYACRVAEYKESMDYLRRAINAGYRKREKFELDPDLTPLRNDPDFKQLIKSL